MGWAGLGWLYSKVRYELHWNRRGLLYVLQPVTWCVCRNSRTNGNY